MVNPDGYLHTQTHDRMWRKTRSPNGGPLGCFGTDPNCNFGYHWGGCSHDRCSSNYGGSEAFSEVETRNIRDFLLSHQGSVKVYNSIGSYGQTIDLPWCWSEEYPDNYEDILALVNMGNDALG